MAPDNAVVPVASYKFDGLTRYMFGNRWSFGIECEVQDCEADPWGTLEPFGSFWLWVGGRTVGNTDAKEQLVLAFDRLPWLALHSGDRKATELPGESLLDKLDFVVWVRFGEDDVYDAQRWGAQDLEALRGRQLGRYEVVPIGLSPWCDGWEAILVEEEDTETLIWRTWHGAVAEVQEAVLPRGLFGKVALAASGWFVPFRRELVGPEKPDTGEKPRLLKRLY
jgi:hypothetical protein